MIKQGLIISIDYTDTYCQVCYYSMRHNRPESVTTGTEVMRYLIPTALTYDMAGSEWLIGNAALEHVQLKEGELYQDFPKRCLKKEQVQLGEKTFTYQELFAIYLGKMIEMARAATAVQSIYNVTVNVRKISLEIKDVFTQSLELIGIAKEKVRFECCAESFAYFILNEDARLWQNGALLFDFSEDGFFVRLMKIKGEKGSELVFVEELDCSAEFSASDLASAMMRRQLDEKIKAMFEDVFEDNPVTSVYFAGSGFNELWFEQTLESISARTRAFKGNNLYVKGACYAGYRRMTEQNDYPILCRERTKIQISIEGRSGNNTRQIVLSPVCAGWHDAGCSLDLIPDNASWVTFKISSLLSDKRNTIDFDIEEFPARPNKATRIAVGVRYVNEEECELFVEDKGFGEFFPSSGKKLVKTISVADYM